MKLETERLYLRHWEPSDFADLADMLAGSAGDVCL